MAWFLKSYRCDRCDTSWKDEWSCACNDRCPSCDAEVEPYTWDDVSVVVAEDAAKGGWVVSVSPPTAEHSPEYVKSYFERKHAADRFGRRESLRLERERFGADFN